MTEHIYSPLVVGPMISIEQIEGPYGYIGPRNHKFLGIYQGDTKVPNFSKLEFTVFRDTL